MSMYRNPGARGMGGLGEWAWLTALHSGWTPIGGTTGTPAPSASTANPNFVNQGDVFNFYIAVNAGTLPYTNSYTSDFRNRLAADGLRPVAVDDTNLGALMGGSIVGQFQAEHGYGAWSEVASRIAGMAVAAGFRVQYSGSSPKIEPFLRNAPPGYSPNTIGSIYAQGNPRGGNSDGSKEKGVFDDVINDLKKMFKVDGTTLALGAMVVLLYTRSK